MDIEPEKLIPLSIPPPRIRYSTTVVEYKGKKVSAI